MSILARPERVADAWHVTPDGLDAALRIMAELYPCVVLDLPRSFNSLSAAALRDADHVLIVTQLAVPFIRNATRIYQSLAEMGTAEEHIEVVINRYKANFERISPDEVEDHFGRPIFGLIPNDYRRVQNSLDMGHPIMADSPSSPARLAIHEMARQLISDHPGMAATPAAGQSFLDKFWRCEQKAKP